MKFAYADPPYLGNGKSKYSEHHDNAGEYDTKEAHVILVHRLVDEYPDGWALSCNPKDLSWILPACPDDVRVAAWVKTFHQIRVNVSVQYAWEPVIFRGGRDMRHRRPMTRDWLSCPIAMRKGLKGAKPDAFFDWVLAMLGWEPQDILDDIFPGTGNFGKRIEHLTQSAGILNQ